MNRLITPCLVLVCAWQCAAVAQPALIASWDFNQGAGEVLLDVSGNGHDGKIIGATWAEGRLGGGLRFDGEDDWVEVPASPSLDAQDAMSIEVWAKLERVGEVKDRVIISRADHPLAYGGWGLNFGYQTDFWWGQDGDYRYLTGLDAGNWHHIVLVTSMGGHMVTLYVDGKLVGRHMWGKAMPKSEFPLLIGRRGQGHHFCGVLDEISLYAGFLTPDQVAARYRGEALPPATARPLPADAPQGLLADARVLGAWANNVSPAGASITYHNLLLGLENTGKDPLAARDVWLQGQHAAPGEMVLAGAATQIVFAGTVPSTIPPGGIGVLNVKLLRSKPLPETLSVVMQCAGGAVLRTEANFAAAPGSFASVGFDDDLQGGWAYLRGTRACELREVELSGAQVKAEWTAPQTRLAEGAVLPLRLRFSQALAPGTPLLLSARTDQGDCHALIHAFAAGFPLGMYRVQKQTVSADYQPPAGREWLRDYIDTFNIAGQGTGQAPDAWLDDCRRHFIDTLVPDYVLLGGDPTIAAKYGLSVVPYGSTLPWHKQNPAVTGWYFADEPGAEPVADVLARFEKLRNADPSRPIVVTINPPVWTRGIDYDFVDCGYQDTYPVPLSPLDEIAWNVAMYRDMIAPRPVCFIPQCFRRAPNVTGGWSRFPTPEEERFMVLMSLAAGARGEVYFAYNVEPGEPIEGCGVSKAPEAKALWAEIGRINLELRTLAPLLARSCVLDSRRQGSVEVARIALGADAVACVVLNHDYEYTEQTFRSHWQEGVSVAVEAPEWLPVADAFEVTAEGLRAVAYADGSLSLPRLQAGTIIVLSADPGLRGRLQARRDELVRAAEAPITTD